MNRSTFLTARSGGYVGCSAPRMFDGMLLDGMLRTVTPTAKDLSGVKIPGQVGMFFCIVPKAEKSTGTQIAPRVSIVASAPCSNSPIAGCAGHDGHAGGDLGARGLLGQRTLLQLTDCQRPRVGRRRESDQV